MKMDNAGERPEGGGLDEAEGSESWYFDLPSGAWERQEQKNRELRQRVLENATDRAERDPFARRKPEPEGRKGGLFGFGRKKEEPAPRESAGGTYRLARGGELPQPPAAGAFNEDDDWSTESFDLPPASPAEAPLRPHDGEWTPPPENDPEDAPDESSRWEGVFGRQENGDQGGLSATSAWPPHAPETEPDEPATPEHIDEDEIDPAHDDILSAMSAWARHTPAGETAAPRSVDDEYFEPPVEPADEPVTPALAAAEAPEPDTAHWGGIFGHDAEAQEDNGLAAMSAWARRRSDDDDAHPASPNHPASDGSDGEGAEDDGPRSWAEIRALRQKQHDEEMQRNSGTATSRWEAMFNVKPGEAGQARPADGEETPDDEPQGIQSEGLAAMRAWLEKGPVVDEDDHPRRILAGDEDEDADPDNHVTRPIPANLLEPFDWERDKAASAPPEISPDLLKPFEWESEDSATGSDDGGRHELDVSSADDDAEPPAAVAPEAAEFAPQWEVDERAAQPDLPADPEPQIPAPSVDLPQSAASDLSLFGDLDQEAADSRPEPLPRKRGLLGRIFGRRSSETPDSDSAADDATPAWFAVDDDGAGDDLRTAAPVAATAEFETASATASDLSIESSWSVQDTTEDEAEPAVAWRWPDPEPQAHEADADTVADEDRWQPFAPAESVEHAAPEVAAELGEDEDAGWRHFEPSDTAAIAEAATLAVPAAASWETDEPGGWAPEPFQQPTAADPTNLAVETEAASGADAAAPSEPALEAPIAELDDAATPSELALEAPVADLDDAAAPSEPALEAPIAELDDDAAPSEPALEAPIASLDNAAPGPVDFDAAESESTEPSFEPPAMAQPASLTEDESAEDDESPWSWDFADLDDEESVVAAEPVATVGDDDFAWVPTDAADGDAPAEAWLAGSEEPIELPLPAPFTPVALEPEVDDDPWSALAEVDEEQPPAEPQPFASIADDDSDEPWAAAEPQPFASIADDNSDEPWAAADALDAASDEAADRDGWPVAAETPDTMAPRAELEDAAEAEPADSGPPGVTPLLRDDPWAEFISRREREGSDEERVAAERWNDVFGTAPQGKSDAEAGDGDHASAEAATADLRDADPFDSDSYVDATEPLSPPPAGADTDDPWAAIAAASGYDAATDSGMAVYTPAEPEARADDPWESFAASHRGHAPEPPVARTSATQERPPAPSEPWDEDEAALSPDEFIVRAFERKAAEQLPEERETSPGANAGTDESVASLLGDEGEAIMRETAESEAGPRSFARMSAWAPQRTGRRVENPNEAPWESDYPGEDDEFTGLGGPSYERPLNADVPPPNFPPSDAFDGFDPQPVPVPVNRSKTKTWVREVVETGLLALLVFLSVRASFQNFKVDGSSMYPTLQNGQFLIVNKLEYSQVDMEKLSNFIPFVDPGANPKRNVFHGPERGDIVVLQDPRKPDTDLIKRIIGLPGETVEIVNGRVYINDHLLEEPYIKSPWHDTKARITIPEGQFYVLGDNRDNSLDSRSSQVGLVPEDLIIGKATLSYWPLDRFGLAPNQGGDISVKDGPPRLTTQAAPAH